jgi:hypothetical protein
MTDLDQKVLEAALQFNRIVDQVEARCMAVDGPVTPTLQEITEQELSDLWHAVQTIRAALPPSPAVVPSGWQSMDTAPRDGTRVILDWGGKARVGYYVDNSKTSRPWRGWKVPSMEYWPSGQPVAWVPFPRVTSEDGASPTESILRDAGSSGSVSSPPSASPSPPALDGAGRDGIVRECASIAHKAHLTYAELRDSHRRDTLDWNRADASCEAAAAVWHAIGDLLPKEANGGGQP